MLDPIIKEIRRLRAQGAKEFWRDPAKYFEERDRRFRAITSNIVQTGPDTFKATFNLPASKIRKKQKPRGKP
jgi:hypothetical protein